MLGRVREAVRTAIKSRTIRYRYNRRVDSLSAAQGVFAKGEMADDARLIDRLEASFNARSERPTGQWSDIFSDRHQDIRDAFGARDRAAIERILRNPATSDIFYGFDPTGRSVREFGLRIEDRHAPRLALDALVSFAEAIGARPLDYPENYGLRRNVISADAVLDEIESALAVRLGFPNPFPGEYGLRTTRGVIGFRTPQAIYQAWRMKRLLGHKANPRVLEIGGGLGRSAYYARAFGLKDYTIVDIPVSSLAQGYFLGRTLGPDRICVQGETPHADAVKLISPKDFFNGSDRYDLILNADSLTEIGRSAANEYWSQIQQRCSVFLSINHEANEFTISDLIGERPALRYPYWMRRGYVEEVVNF